MIPTAGQTRLPIACIRLWMVVVPAALPGVLLGQVPGPQAPPLSPEIHGDSSITLRVLAPAASSVSVGGDMIQDRPRRVMTKDTSGVWSVTMGPFAPDLYDHNFEIDGVTVLDPGNPSVTLGPRTSWSLVDVPGAHQWQVWRRNFIALAPLLFRG